jgi:hypothetical protein
LRCCCSSAYPEAQERETEALKQKYAAYFGT